MDYSNRLELSYYKPIAAINEEHRVYLVQHQNTNKIYIKKILSVYNLQIYSYLIEHPIIGIPHVISMYEEDQKLTLIEEYISGTSLSDILADGHLNETDIVHDLCELCDILKQLHTLQPPIVHRDIKPSNIIITPYNHVMLLDFNAAKYLKDVQTTDTVLLGTKGYAAPEQYGFGSSTPQTDIYALGILLREMTDSLPHPAGTFDAIIEQCTKLSPDDRFSSVDDLKQALKNTMGCQPVKASLTRADSEAKSGLRHRFIPPGFRTMTPWKIFIAIFSYTIIFWIGLSLQVKNASGFGLWIQRFFCLVMGLSIVFITCNYAGIQKMFPLCHHRFLPVRIFGVLVMDIAAVIFLFLLMFIFIMALS